MDDTESLFSWKFLPQRCGKKTRQCDYGREYMRCRKWIDLASPSQFGMLNLTTEARETLRRNALQKPNLRPRPPIPFK